MMIPTICDATQAMIQVICQLSASLASWLVRRPRSLKTSQMMSDGRIHRIPPRCAKDAHCLSCAASSGAAAAAYGCCGPPAGCAYGCCGGTLEYGCCGGTLEEGCCGGTPPGCCGGTPPTGSEGWFGSVIGGTLS